MRLSILTGDVSVPAYRIEIRRSSTVIGAGLVNHFYNSIGEYHEPIAGSHSNGSSQVAAIAFDSKWEARPHQGAR
jgi:hypothetical protein